MKPKNELTPVGNFPGYYQFETVGEELAGRLLPPMDDWQGNAAYRLNVHDEVTGENTVYFLPRNVSLVKKLDAIPADTDILIEFTGEVPSKTNTSHRVRLYDVYADCDPHEIAPIEPTTPGEEMEAPGDSEIPI